MAYTPQKPALTPTSDELRARIPGWGADLDPKDRPAVPKLQFDPTLSGAHWEFPERQEEKYPRERSIEHKFLTPVFGTSCPPKGLSGVMRRYAYRRFSEARAAHWLILLAADRVDAVESHLASFLTLHPDNPVTETGVLSEFSRRGYSSRVGRKRADVNHQWIDPILIGGPWLLAGAGLAAGIAAAVRRLRS
ncbi:hypothetical protein LJ754_05370 [Arthrobacter sp. zg-Y40]|uniref:hypothetical protein n=1 Tax=unclassified Arthrobacter TaxID=235627 RepID=UPI001D13925F|nr:MULTISPECIES: hypothetical protein [unclassified Arthrobacter]MCC3275515.1 hypothetical protein [Arthrobacter sp. zg-Y20]MCC3278589.1 hypothetical protein [Arthrobacter sp. zg-Y40]MDK1315672.1 hypothetical protein [Arthrobacter sp. zg.Y20]WIB06082.1 hypothetical protein QNO06_16450 [Arthrobacter sp. zg-Y20]